MVDNTDKHSCFQDNNLGEESSLEMGPDYAPVQGEDEEDTVTEASMARINSFDSAKDDSKILHVWHVVAIGVDRLLLIILLFIVLVIGIAALVKLT